MDLFSFAKDVLFKMIGSFTGRLTLALNAVPNESFFYTPDSSRHKNLEDDGVYSYSTFRLSLRIYSEYPVTVHEVLGFVHYPYSSRELNPCWQEVDDKVFMVEDFRTKESIDAFLGRPPSPGEKEISNHGAIEIKAGGSITLLVRKVGTFHHSVSHGTRDFVDLPRETEKWPYWDAFFLLKINTSYVMLQTILPEYSGPMKSTARLFDPPVFLRTRDEKRFFEYADSYVSNLDNHLSERDYVSLWRRIP